MSKSKLNTIDNINPVDYYNRKCINDAIDILLDINNVQKVDISSFTYIQNKSDEQDKKIIIVDGNFEILKSSRLNLYVNETYSPFMLIQAIKFKNNFTQTLHYVMHEIMDIKIDFIRVNTKYYKIINKIDRYNVHRRELRLWDKMTIMDDYGRSFLDKINKYDDFVMFPDNKNYESVIRNNYNLYSPFAHKPLEPIENYDKALKWTFTLLKHIFGDQYELGLKYFKVLYDHPTQILPILVLVSEERETGKTTLTDWVNILFGSNSVVINPQDISNSFNAAYTDKNIIIIEESRFESVQATEKLKNLSTQKKILVNTKHVSQYSIPFYGKLIITSNDEKKFSKVDNPEIRYWVRKVPTITIKNHNILNDLVSEIPYFLHYLDSLPDIDRTKSRMVFTKEEIETEALKTVKVESRTSLHKDIEMLLDEYSMQNNKVESFDFTAIDVKEKFFKHTTKIDVNYINKTIRDNMKLTRKKQCRYYPLATNNMEFSNKKNGKPYTYKNKYYGQTFE